MAAISVKTQSMQLSWGIKPEHGRNAGNNIQQLGLHYLFIFSGGRKAKRG